MLKSQHYLLATACVALLGAASYASSASAQTCYGQTNCSLGETEYTFGANDIFGGGSSLVAPYWRQTADCYANPADLITKATPPTFVDETLFDYTGATPQNCATQHIVSGKTAWYISTGSGTGISGVYSHNPALYGDVNLADATQQFPEVHYGLSDAGLAQSDVTIYTNGGTEQSVTVGSPGQYPCGNAAPNYANPLQCFGPLVQFPFSIDPVALAYQGVYEKILNADGTVTSYSFNIAHPRADGSGGLRLDQTTYCKIYNGQITNWNDPALKADNGGRALYATNDPNRTTFSVPLTPIARSDSSGTTSIFTRHLAAACAALTGNQYTTGATTLAGAGAGSLVGTTYNIANPNFPGVDQTGKVTMAPNSSGVAQYLAFTATPTGSNSNCTVPKGAKGCIMQARIAYIGPDYVLPYVTSTNTNSYGLQSATLENVSNQWEEPTPTGAAKGFSAVQPPQSNANGSYNANNTTFGVRSDPADWVQGLAPTSVLANPTTSGAYPIVGTTNFLGYTCYAEKGAETNLDALLKFVVYTKTSYDPKLGILATAGLSPLPAQWRVAIDQTFVSNTAGLGLNIATVGNPGACSVAGVVGG